GWRNPEHHYVRATRQESAALRLEMGKEDVVLVAEAAAQSVEGVPKRYRWRCFRRLRLHANACEPDQGSGHNSVPLQARFISLGSERRAPALPVLAIDRDQCLFHCAELELCAPVDFDSVDQSSPRRGRPPLPWR